MSNKRLNLLFGLGPMALIMVGMWGIYNNSNIPALASLAPWRVLGSAVLVLAGLSLISSIFVFHDSLREMGLGGPSLFRKIRSSQGGEQRLVLCLLIVVNLAVIVAYVAGAEKALDWVFGWLAGTFGVRKAPAAMLWFPILTLNVTLGWVIRYDNFWKALPGFLLSLAVGVGFLLATTAIIDRVLAPDENVWLRWDWARYAQGVLGRYILWGTIQQFLFLSILNTRFRKGLSNPWMSAVCTGLCFGAIHAPVWTLSVLTFLGGTLWGWFFQKNPNLIIAGFVHGCLGTYVSIMLSHPWVPMKVGPIGM